MPELPEVETVASALRQQCEGQMIEKVLCRRHDLRYPLPKDFAATLTGRKIARVERRAKYILMTLNKCSAGSPQNHSGGEIVLILHLGMSGRVLIHDKPPAAYATHDHVILTFQGGKTLIYNDARRFGLMALCRTGEWKRHPFFKTLGPEPLSEAFMPDSLHKAFGKRKAGVKAALMDQRVVAGLGNIYVCEALFRSGVSPHKQASKISREKTATLVKNIRKVLEEAIESGGSTLRDYVRSNGDPGYFQHRFFVYGREHESCLVCGTSIKRTVQQGRSTFFCPACQK